MKFRFIKRGGHIVTDGHDDIYGNQKTGLTTSGKQQYDIVN